MKTLEFKLSVNQSQAALIDKWLVQLKMVWNKGLELLLDHEQRQWRKHPSRRRAKTQVPGSFVLKFSAKKFEDVNEKGTVKVRWGRRRLTGSGVRETKAGHSYCPIRVRMHDDIDPKKFFESGSYYNNDLMPELMDVPSKFRTGAHKSLKQSWKVYKDPKHPGRRPKFKRKNDRLKSLVNYNAGGKSQELNPVAIAGTDNGYVQFPKLGKLHVKGLYKRFDPTRPYSNARILREPSGYYLQVVVEADERQLKPNNKAVGIDPGVKAVVALDDGRLVQPGKFLSKQEKRLTRLQRKLSRQQHGSKSYDRTQHRIAKCHEKVRRSRSAFNHKLSTKIVREYGAISFEGTQLKNMTRKPKAKKRADGSYAPNQASAKAGLNKSILDVGIGDLRAKIKTKAAAWGREYDQPDAKNTSQLCHCCKQKGDRRTQAEFICLNNACTLQGIVQQADVNAARNVLQNASFWETGKYRTLDWTTSRPLTPVAAKSQGKALRKLKREARVSNSPSRSQQSCGAPEGASAPPGRELSAPIPAPLGRDTVDAENPKTEYLLNPLPAKGRRRKPKQPTRDIGVVQLSLDFDTLNSA